MTLLVSLCACCVRLGRAASRAKTQGPHLQSQQLFQCSVLSCTDANTALPRSLGAPCPAWSRAPVASPSSVPPPRHPPRASPTAAPCPPDSGTKSWGHWGSLVPLLVTGGCKHRGREPACLGSWIKNYDSVHDDAVRAESAGQNLVLGFPRKNPRVAGRSRSRHGVVKRIRAMWGMALFWTPLSQVPSPLRGPLSSLEFSSFPSPSLSCRESLFKCPCNFPELSPDQQLGTQEVKP